MKITGKKVFITGGAGFLGRELVKKLYPDNEITIFSRDESKHYYLQKKYPKINCVIGDVRNLDLLLRSSKNHDIGIFAASLKQIEAVDQNVEEAIQVIIHGSINSRRSAIESNMDSACFISSDKSRAATTLYGAMKFIGGESFIVNAETSKTNLSSVIYGNVLNSTGSVIPLIWDSINNKYPLTLYSETMTRFLISVDDAINLIEKSLDTDGYNIIPNLKSFKIKDLFDIFEDQFGLKYNLGKPRISEKIHEMMIAPEEMPRTLFDEENNLFKMHYKRTFQNHINQPLTSDQTLMSKNELFNILNENNFFQS